MWFSDFCPNKFYECSWEVGKDVPVSQAIHFSSMKFPSGLLNLWRRPCEIKWFSNKNLRIRVEQSCPQPSWITNNIRKRESYPSMRDNLFLCRSKYVNFSRPQKRVLFNIVIRLKLKSITLISLHVWKRWPGISVNPFPDKEITCRFTRSLKASLHVKMFFK